MKIRIVVTICSKTVTVDICYTCLEFNIFKQANWDEIK